MKKIWLCLIILIAAAIFMLPLPVNAGTSDITWHGYLMDSDSAKVAYKAGSALDFVQNYDRETAVSAKAQAAGYMLFAGKWFHLDKHGNGLAIEAIKHSAKKKGLYVTVGGKLKGDIIVVESLVEVVDTPEANF